MKSRFLTTMGLAGVLLAGSFTATTLAQAPEAPETGFAEMSQRHGKRHRGMRGMMKGRIARALDLTDAQRQQIRALHEAERERTATQRDQLRELRRAMSDATKAGAFNEAQVRSIAQQQAAIATELKVSRARIQSNIYNTVLTPEQRVKVDELAAKRAERRGKRFAN